MSLLSRQIELNDSTATPLLVQGFTGTDFPRTVGSTQDPIPVVIQNQDAAIGVYIGGPDVASDNGYLLPAGGTIPMALLGESEIPYAISASGTPIVCVLCGRQ